MTKYLTPKKYEALPDADKAGWFPQYREYTTTITQEMDECEHCGTEFGMRDVETKVPVGEPYRYAWTVMSDLQVYFAKKLASHTMLHLATDNVQAINFTRHSPLEEKQ